jgi:hypothetical protein
VHKTYGPPEDGIDQLLLGGAKRSWHVYSEPVPKDEKIEILLGKIMRTKDKWLSTTD